MLNLPHPPYRVKNLLEKKFEVDLPERSDTSKPLELREINLFPNSRLLLICSVFQAFVETARTAILRIGN